MPEEWQASGYKKLVSNSGRIDAFYLTVLYDLASQKSSLPLKSFHLSSARPFGLQMARPLRLRASRQLEAQWKRIR